MIDISTFSKASVLVALYNNSKPLGLGLLQFDPADMTLEEAQSLVDNHNYFDYVHGRVLKVRLNDTGQLDPALYDRDNGEGAAQRAIDNI